MAENPIASHALPQRIAPRALFLLERLERRSLLSAAVAGSDHEDLYGDSAAVANAASENAPTHAQRGHIAGSGLDGESESEGDATAIAQKRSPSLTATSEADDDNAQGINPPDTRQSNPSPPATEDNNGDVPVSKAPQTSNDDNGSAGHTPATSDSTATGPSNQSDELPSEQKNESPSPTATPSPISAAPQPALASEDAHQQTTDSVDSPDFSASVVDVPLAVQAPLTVADSQPLFVSSAIVAPLKDFITAATAATAKSSFSELQIVMPSADFGAHIFKTVSTQLAAVANMMAAPRGTGTGVFQSTQRIVHQFARLGDPMLLMNDSLAILADDSVLSARTPLASRMRRARFITAAVIIADAAILIYARRRRSTRDSHRDLRLIPIPR